MSNDNDGTPFDEPDGEPESFPVPPEPASAGPAAAPCQDCGGSGQIVLLTSSRVCRRCGGAGRLKPAGAKPERTVEERDEVIYTYDLHGRLTSVSQPFGARAVWRFEEKE